MYQSCRLLQKHVFKKGTAGTVNYNYGCLSSRRTWKGHAHFGMMITHVV